MRGLSPVGPNLGRAGRERAAGRRGSCPERPAGRTIRRGRFPEGLHHSASRRPLDLEGVAFDGLNVEVAFDREAKDPFASTLTDLAKWLKRGRESNARLLRELPDGGDTGFLACIHFAFRD